MMVMMMTITKIEIVIIKNINLIGVAATVQTAAPLQWAMGEGEGEEEGRASR